ncbi:hypothetical protein PR048_033025 [Dryococelus australis]|uniref:Uncharacterized protein n=1 Tax=Dryococelus australis TaxID=614101 RepID=A0ABQ9G6Q5_9NEOP|nr:hypothetical protein PR048_033025 [Dryococelus australis]
MQDDHSKWDTCLLKIIFTLWLRRNKALGASPSKLLFCQPFQRPKEWDWDAEEYLKHADASRTNHDMQAKRKYHLRYASSNKGRRHCVGKHTAISCKSAHFYAGFHPKQEGPYTVAERRCASCGYRMTQHYMPPAVQVEPEHSRIAVCDLAHNMAPATSPLAPTVTMPPLFPKPQHSPLPPFARTSANQKEKRVLSANPGGPITMQRAASAALYLDMTPSFQLAQMKTRPAPPTTLSCPQRVIVELSKQARPTPS